MSEGIIYFDRQELIDFFATLKQEPITTARNAYLELSLYGPVKYRKTAISGIMRAWKMNRQLAVKILRKLVNGGFVTIGDGQITAVPYADRKPSAFFEEGGSWRILRQLVFERDGFECTYCGETNGTLHADHIVPRSKGGPDELANLTTACARCNLSKGAKSVEEWRS